MVNNSPDPTVILLLAILSIHLYYQATHLGQAVAPFISTKPSTQT